MTTTRLGMVGCGLISHAHGRAARKSRHDISFSACMSRRLETAESWAAEYDCAQAYDDLGQMLAAEKLDGVVIASWPALHCEQIIACIEAGVPAILCEKALVTSGAEAMQVRSAATSAGARVVEGFMYRHHPAIRRLEALAGSDAHGPVGSIHAVFNMLDETEEADPPGWRRSSDAGGGVAHDFLCYPVDAVCHFARALPVSVQAIGARGAHGTLEQLSGFVEFADGVVATVESSRRAGLNQRLEIRCARTTLALPFAWTTPGDIAIEITHTTGFLDQESEREAVFPETGHDGRLIDFPVFTRQMDNFIEVIRGDSAPLVAAVDSVRNACVIDALLASVESGAREPINLPEPVLRQ